MVAQLDAETVRARPGRVVPRLLSYALFEGRPATTRGAWINPVVRANLALGEALHAGRRPEKPVFIVGIGRSGTTLLGQLFGVHSHVGFLNEPKAIWHRIVPDEDLIGSYGPEPVRLRLDETDATPEAARRAREIYGWYLRVTRSRRVVDKYPEFVYRTTFLRALFPDARIIAIVRRPWDVVESIDEWGRRKATQDADWWGVGDRKWRVLWEQGVLADPRWRALADAVEPARADPRTRAAVEWTLGTAEALALPSQIGDAVRLVRYDDLVSAPRDVVTDLLHFCELPVEAPVLDLAEARVVRRRSPTRPVDTLPAGLRSAVDEVAAAAGYH